jgi:hypothetical protein
VIGHDGNTPVGMAILEQFDLLDGCVEVIAGMDDEKQ